MKKTIFITPTNPTPSSCYILSLRIKPSQVIVNNSFVKGSFCQQFPSYPSYELFIKMYKIAFNRVEKSSNVRRLNYKHISNN